jgi:hypothetical protein
MTNSIVPDGTEFSILIFALSLGSSDLMRNKLIPNQLDNEEGFFFARVRHKSSPKRRITASREV